MKKKMKKGMLRYRHRIVNPRTFNVGRKDLRRLVGYCCGCGCRLQGRSAIPASDPYQADVYDDNTPVVQCDRCAAEAAADI